MSFLQQTRNHTHRLVLGTAQLGMSYGIANQIGKPDAQSADEILRAAYESGTDILDTAQAYGNSEQVIGSYLRRNPQHRFHVISKLKPDVDVASQAAIVEAIQSTTKVMGTSLAGMMLHNASHLHSWKNGLNHAFRQSIDEGLIESAGVSIYTAEQFILALEIDDIKLIQVPFNAMDRRLLSSGAFQRARDLGKIIFIRSIYLQGLLLMDAGVLPDGLDFARDAVFNWREVCKRHDVEPMMAALKYVQAAVADGYLVLGCESARQWRENVAISQVPNLDPRCMADINAMPQPEERVINPSLWKR